MLNANRIIEASKMKMMEAATNISQLYLSFFFFMDIKASKMRGTYDAKETKPNNSFQIRKQRTQCIECWFKNKG
jgi:hypothetical protein